MAARPTRRSIGNRLGPIGSAGGPIHRACG